MEDQHLDPNNWKLRIFYYNKNDKRIFVPKRNPAFGSTVNFANPYSLLLLIPIVFVVVTAFIY